MENLAINIGAAVAALAATIIGSFAGGGSSLIMFPLLLSFVPGGYLALFLISKISAAVMTATSGRIHFKRGGMDLKVLGVIIFAGILGTVFGTYLLTYHFDEVLFKKLMIALIFLSAFYVMVSGDKGLRQGTMRKFDRRLIANLFVMSFIVNILNGILGGTGLLMTIYLVVYLRMEFIKAIAYTMITYAVLSTIQAAYLAFTVEFDGVLALSVVVGAVVGGYLGTNLQYLKGNLMVKRAAVVVMVAVGVKMLVDL